MAESAKRQTPPPRLWMAPLAALLLAALLTPVLAQEQTDPKLAALLPKARQLQHDGDLLYAQQIAQFEVDHHNNLGELAGGLESLASIYKQSGRFEKALQTVKHYQQVLQTIPNADASKQQDMHLLSAEILAILGKYAEALGHIDDGLKIPNGWRATDSLWEAHTYALRAQIEKLAGNNEAARADWQQVEARTDNVLKRIRQAGVNVDLEEGALKLLTASLVSTDRTAEAIEMRQRFMARQLDDQVRARNWSEIALCYALLEQDAGQEHALREALALETRQEGPRAKAAQADLLDRLALVLKHQGDPAAAQARWKESAATYRELIDRHAGRRRLHDRQMSYMARLQGVYERLGQWQSAIDVGEELLDEASQTCLPGDPRIWRAKGTLAALYVRTGDASKAHALLIDTLDYWRRQVPPPAAELSQTLIQLSKISGLKGDLKDARSFAEEALTVCQQAPPGNELRLAMAYDNLADLFAGQKEYRSAIEQYRHAIQICRDRPQDRQANYLLCATLVDVSKIYKAQHQYRRAAECCAQALKLRQQTDKDPRALVGIYTALATLELADLRRKSTGDGRETELADAEANVAAARKLCQQQGWLEGAAGIQVLQLEAVVDVRRDKPEAAKKSLDEALAISRRADLGRLESKILAQLAQLEQHASSTGTATTPTER
jgi:tetratricopeptide (TPR) repeat protein